MGCRQREGDRGEERRYFLELLGIRHRKKGSKGPTGGEGERAKQRPQRHDRLGKERKPRKEQERKKRLRKKNFDCLISHLNSKKAGKNAAATETVNPLGVDTPLKAI